MQNLKFLFIYILWNIEANVFYLIYAICSDNISNNTKLEFMWLTKKSQIIINIYISITDRTSVHINLRIHRDMYFPTKFNDKLCTSFKLRPYLLLPIILILLIILIILLVLTTTNYLTKLEHFTCTYILRLGIHINTSFYWAINQFTVWILLTAKCYLIFFH